MGQFVFTEWNVVLKIRIVEQYDNTTSTGVTKSFAMGSSIILPEDTSRNKKNAGTSDKDVLLALLPRK